MPAKPQNIALDFAFFTHLHDFYKTSKGRVRQHYRDISKRFLDFNNPDNSHSFLRQPQFEALEMYIFLKEYLDNAPVHNIFQEWRDMTGRFAGRRQLALFEDVNRETYDAVFRRMKAGERTYPNYIFALTMGTGKTILMATCIFYEFILANKFPSDPTYCHNALVFAPDTTVLQALREIMTFDKGRVVPPEYEPFLTANLKFHFLEEAGTTLSTIDHSRFNLVIANTQKIILKRSHREKSFTDKLFGSDKPIYTPGSVYEEFADLYAETLEDEGDLITNQRFEKLRRLEQLGIYVDEAHHAFGATLERDMGIGSPAKTSLRTTIDELAASLSRKGAKVVGCYNYTGTPYVRNQVLPEVVYTFGLQDAIDKHYLKQPRVHGYENPRSDEFVNFVLDDFLTHHPLDARYEGMRPKLAFFAATIDELQNELRPAVEAALARHPGATTPNPILINVGDEKLTSNDDIRDFNRLDTPASDKQIILLVGKGREGWNCRSLFGVALFRQPKSKIFVLQATMRCLRSITDAQQTGGIYLSRENIAILENELQQNFRMDVETFGSSKRASEPRRIKVKQPIEKVKLTRIRRRYEITERPIPAGASLGLDAADTQRYHIVRTVHDGLPTGATNRQYVVTDDLTEYRTQIQYSALTLNAEIARYLNLPCLEIESLLAQTAEGPDGILEHVNRFNQLLYDIVIPRLFELRYTISAHEQTEDYEVDLVKAPPEGHYEVTAAEEMVVNASAVVDSVQAAKSFHLDPYCFDSAPERNLFWDLLRDGRVTKLYFTGMLTHGQSEFYIQYIDPDSHTIRSYYPDFLVQKDDGRYIIVEVKGDNQIEAPVVLAKKAFAEQMAQASGMTYEIIKGSDANAGRYSFLLENPGERAEQPTLH